MNKSLCAAGLGMACSWAMAQSSVTLAGTVDVGLRHVKNGSVGSLTSEASGANSTSKLIVRGQEDLGRNLRAGFYLDSTILADMGGAGASAPAGQFWDRQSTVNLAHTRLGELRLGRDWIPVHLVWSNFDPFAALGIARANNFRSLTAARALGQAFGTTPETQNATPILRVSNALEYFLPPDLWGCLRAHRQVLGRRRHHDHGFTKGDGFRLGWARAPSMSRRRSSRRATRPTASASRTRSTGLLRLRLGEARRRAATLGVRLGPHDQHPRRRHHPGGPGRGEAELPAGQPEGRHRAGRQRRHAAGRRLRLRLSKRTALYAHASYVENQGSACSSSRAGRR